MSLNNNEGTYWWRWESVCLYNVKSYLGQPDKLDPRIYKYYSSVN